MGGIFWVRAQLWKKRYKTAINPLMPNRYSELWDEPFPLQIKQLKVGSKLNVQILFFLPRH